VIVHEVAEENNKKQASQQKQKKENQKSQGVRSPRAAPKPEINRPTRSFFSSFADDLPPCSQSHCSAVDSQIYAICQRKGWGADMQLPTRDSDGTLCYCSCSCLAYGTEIAVPDGAKEIQDFVKGDAVLVVEEDGQSKKWVPAKVRSASPPAGLPQNPLNYAIRVKVAGKVLISNADHIYMTGDGTFKRADRLKIGDELMSSEFKPVPVESVVNGEFHGSLANIETDADEDSTYGHLINSEGVISGDYFLQKKMAGTPGLVEEPQVGSPQYIDRNPGFIEDASSIEPEEDVDGGFVPAGREGERGVIVGHFIPDEADEPKLSLQFRAMDDSVTEQHAQQVLNLFAGYYPGIRLRLLWNSNTVNAFAGYDADGTPTVEIHGGLVRHPDIRIEALALVVAHEIGHHEGGPPTYPNDPRSCEGQSDYYGAAVIMREVYPGRQYLDYMIPATDQLHAFFTVGLVEDQNSEEVKQRFAANNCGHPPADCRRDTYNAAIDLDPKPACAGFVDSDPDEPVGRQDPGVRIIIDFEKSRFAELAPCQDDTCLTEPARSLVQQICRQIGLGSGSHLVVRKDDGTPCLCRCYGATNSSKEQEFSLVVDFSRDPEFREVRECDREHCTAYSEIISQVCKSLNWPVPIRVFTRQEDGAVCYCTCH
jgi:hypothetical protein